MTYRILFYCPDRHIEYSGRTPEIAGVGGGITSRVRMARGLASRGHEVFMVVNCPRQEEINGVQYIPLDDFNGAQVDVLIGNTSGGDLDLSGVSVLDISASIRILWVSGVQEPRGLDAFAPDFIYPKSNYLREEITKRWKLSSNNIFVTYNGFEADYYQQLKIPKQLDGFGLLYASHPKKGLEAALGVLGFLRRHDTRYRLRIFGSEKLWGDAFLKREYPDGVDYFGLIGQRELARQMAYSSFLLSLQDIREGFGLTVLEAMRVGCCVLASDVGAYPEIIRNNENGIIVSGDHRNPDVWKKAARTIQDLQGDGEKLQAIRDTASKVPWSIDLMCHVWEGHWNRLLENDETRLLPAGECSVCKHMTFKYPDGVRCSNCGHYEFGKEMF